MIYGVSVCTNSVCTQEINSKAALINGSKEPTFTLINDETNG